MLHFLLYRVKIYDIICVNNGGNIMSVSQQKKQEAIEFFVRIGLLIPVDSLDLYHARTRKSDEQPGTWVVDPKRRFSGHNNGRRDLSTTESLEFAKGYAAQQVASMAKRGIEVKPEVYKIVSVVEGAFIINTKFDINNLSEEDKKKYEEYAPWLVAGRVSEYAPIDFRDRNRASEVFEYIRIYREAAGLGFLTNDDVEKIFLELSQNDSGLTKQLVKDIVGALNARMLVLVRPQDAAYCLQEGQDYLPNKNGGSGIPLNLDYIAHFAKLWGIVGTKVEMTQYNGKEDCYFFFDTYAINTRSAKAKMIADMMDNYSGIIDLLGEFDDKDNNVMKTLQESNPENIIDTLQADKRFAPMFTASAGVWEGFSIGEHTETCLRIFDKGISSEMPKELHPYMRLAIICHDIGKGMPRENHDTQLYNNLKYARQFMAELGVPKEVIEVVCTIIEAQEYTSDYYVRGEKGAEKSLFLFLTAKLQKIYGIAPSDEMVNGLMSMCKALQICDSGAYTIYGVTRDKKTGMYYKNGNKRFTESFEEPTDITHDRLRFKNDPTL